MSKLLGPSIDILAKMLSDGITNPLGSSEIKNLRHHAERVLEEETSREKIEPTRKQRENLLNWFDEAGNFDPEQDAHNSAIWEAILAEIIGRNDKLVIDTLKSMTSTDVEIIFRLKVEGGVVSQGQAARLVQLGIAEKLESFTSKSIRKHIYLIGVMLLSYAFMRSELFRIYMDIWFNSDSDIYNRLGIYLSDSLRLTIIVAGVFLGFRFYIRHESNKGRIYFTDLGLKIKDKIDTFMRGFPDR